MTTRRADEFNHHGFGVSAIEHIAAALNHDIGGCGDCDPDATGEPCVDEHFYPFAESALRGLRALMPPLEVTDRDRRIMASEPTPADHQECLEEATALLELISQETPHVYLKPVHARCLGAELFLRSQRATAEDARARTKEESKNQE
jgi:hypothetical protein